MVFLYSFSWNRLKSLQSSMSYWRWNLWRQDCRDSLIWPVMVDPKLRIYQEFTWLLVSQGCQALRQPFRWTDVMTRAHELLSPQLSFFAWPAKMLDITSFQHPRYVIFCVLEDLLLLTIVCAETSLPSFQGFLLCDKLSGRLFENWSLILLQTLWCYNFLFQTGTKQILDSAISV